MGGAGVWGIAGGSPVDGYSCAGLLSLLRLPYCPHWRRAPLSSLPLPPPQMRQRISPALRLRTDLKRSLLPPPRHLHHRIPPLQTRPLLLLRSSRRRRLPASIRRCRSSIISRTRRSPRRQPGRRPYRIHRTPTRPRVSPTLPHRVSRVMAQLPFRHRPKQPAPARLNRQIPMRRRPPFPIRKSRSGMFSKNPTPSDRRSRRAYFLGA